MSRQPDRSPQHTDYHVFVPAVMGAGVLFSLLVLVRQWLDRLLGRRGHRAIAETQARSVVAEVLHGQDQTEAAPGGRTSSRRVLVVLAAASLGVALYLLPGATFNYLRPGGYLAEIAWILAVALVLVVAFVALGVVLAVSAVRPTGPLPSGRRVLQATEALQRSARAHEPAHRSWGAAWHGTASVVVLAVAVTTAVLTLAVAMGNPTVHRWDLWLLGHLRDTGPLQLLRVADHLGRTEVTVVVSLIAALVLRRRAPQLAMAFPVGVLAGIGINVVLKLVIARPRPTDPVVGTALPSYPSGHTIQAVLLAVFVTLVIHELVRGRVVAWLVGSVLGVGAILTGLGRVIHAAHWPSDVIGGALVGVTIALVAVLAIHPRAEPVAGRRVLLMLPETLAPRARLAARTLSVVAVVTFAVLAATTGIPQDPEGGVGTPRIEQVLQLGLLGLVAIGASIAWRWEAVGATCLAVAGTGMALFASVQYRPLVALGVAIAFLLPAVLFWISWQHGMPARALAVTATVAAILLAGTWAGATSIYDHYFGPSHPQSALTAVRSSMVEWAWSGGLGSDRVTINAKLARDAAEVEVWVSRSDDLSDPRRVPAAPSDPRADDRVVRATVDSPEPDTRYHYGIVLDGELDVARLGRFRTAPDGPGSFTVVFGACARTGSNGLVFETIAEVDPLLYLITGDFHYGDVASPNAGWLRTILDRTIMAPAQQALYLQSPVAYVWDDHDYGGNDSDTFSPARDMAQQVYRSYVPHGPLASDDSIEQAFTIGRVRFILTDLRSHRRPAADGSGTMFGQAQLEWFVRELSAAHEAGQLIVWVSPTPWIGEPRPGADTWAGFDEERRLIADLIDRNGIDRIVMLSGDAHMVAIDDGSNSGYASSGAPGFPVAHGGALDRPGSLKGGPYSEGAYPGSGQFGVLEVDDDGSGVFRLRVTGRDWRGEELVALEIEIGDVTEGPGLIAVARR
jgi:membrane-associated phospholipid phosphatase/phosphodiesterase/alkaline phosphatase D-like protein